MRVDISIVILHYNDAEMTINYVKDLEALNWKDIRFHIVIVDNASPDKSGLLLLEEYKDSEKITVLLNHENLGFARGNNVGIRYSYDELDAELIAVSNSDIIIEDIDFFQKLWKIYADRPAAVIGPDIYSLNKKIHQSPIRNSLLTKKDLQKKISYIDDMLTKLRIIQKLRIYDLISRVKRILGKRPGTEGYKYSESQRNVVLQGAFFVLSRDYLQGFPKGLYDKTFLYMEEDILAYLCHAEGLDMIYDPTLKVKHLDGYATMKKSGDRCRKYIFELTETKKSCEIMLALIESDAGHIAYCKK